jgi:hypothetical protein
MNRALVPPMVGVAFIAALVLGAGPSMAGKPKPPSWALHGSYSPKIDPANFVAAVDNRYFPLRPGTAFHYNGFKGKTPQIDDMVVTRQTVRILGVTCTVVRDTVSQHGKPLERTFDWYAQDKQGNVWYMGEDARELQNGRFVRASDSWKAGANGAKPGIIMRGNPKLNEVYRQEYYPPGGALDQARARARRERESAVWDLREVARHDRVEPGRTAVREEVLREWNRRGQGAGDPRRPRTVRAGQPHTRLSRRPRIRRPQTKREARWRLES